MASERRIQQRRQPHASASQRLANNPLGRLFVRAVQRHAPICAASRRNRAGERLNLADDTVTACSMCRVTRLRQPFAAKFNLDVLRRVGLTIPDPVSPVGSAGDIEPFDGEQSADLGHDGRPEILFNDQQRSRALSSFHARSGHAEKKTMVTTAMPRVIKGRITLSRIVAGTAADTSVQTEL
jgi:hypothetical protein